MGLTQELATSQNRIADCIRLAAIWLAHIDGTFDQKERDRLADRIDKQSSGIPFARLVAYVEEAMGVDQPTELASAFGYLGHAIPEHSRSSFVSFAVEIAVADGRISIGERHALMFLADLVGRTDELPKAYSDATGLEFGTPGDLSDPAYWDAIAASKSKNAGGQRQSKSGSEGESRREQRAPPRQDNPRRVAALAILGLTGNPTHDEVRLAYRRLARVHHPDRYQGQGHDSIQHATEAFKRIQNAYDSLME